VSDQKKTRIAAYISKKRKGFRNRKYSQVFEGKTLSRKNLNLCTVTLFWFKPFDQHLQQDLC
ncbi:unnamed protein product, partial [Urochloa humidicola]